MNEWEWQLLEERTTVENVVVDGIEVHKGDYVRLRPRAGGDIFDLALAGQSAVVESIEQDYEGQLQLAVVLEEDPGKDLGMMRQPGHRFFFKPGEVEPLCPPKILVAGIGNIFLGDDGFGVEVIRRLGAFPSNVTAKDFGIRGYDLAYALLDSYDTAILIDATPRGDAPGTLYLIEPEVEQTDAPSLDAHVMNPLAVLQLARNMGPVSCRILLVGCEPGFLGGEEGHMGLSDPVANAVGPAAKFVEEQIARITREHFNQQPDHNLGKDEPHHGSTLDEQR